MKKILLLFFVLAQVTLFGQYQLRNSNFEEWENLQADSIEPVNWNSHYTNQGGLAGMARGKQIKRSTDTRTGSGYSCQIWARSVLGIAIANGLVTTGRVNAGSYTAADPANHNVTLRENDRYNAPFTGKPDSIRFWAKFSCPSATQEARMHAVIHGDFNCTDPATGNTPDFIVGDAIAQFTTSGWTQYTVPFSYNNHPHTDARYILVTFATNKTPGEGSRNDTLWVDDIEMIYNARLSNLQVNGSTIGGFDPDIYDYYDSTTHICIGGTAPAVVATPASPHANTPAVALGTFANPVTTITVTQGESTKTYRIHYTVFPGPEVQDVYTLCGSGMLDIEVTPFGSSQVRWFHSSQDVNPFHTGSSYLTPAISEDTYYFVSSYDPQNNCASEMIKISVYVNPVPAIPQVTDVTRCGAGSVTLTATPGQDATTCLWYKPVDNSIDTIYAGSGTTFITPVENDTTTFYVQSYNETTGCKSSALPVKAIVIPLPASPVVSDGERCGAGDITLTAALGETGDAWRWYIHRDDPVFHAENTDLTVSVTKDSVFFITSFDSETGCESEKIEVHAIPNPTYHYFVDSVFACDSHVWNDSIYTEDGLYTHHLYTQKGCDSIVSIYLTISENLYYQIYDSVCHGNGYSNHGFTIPVSDLSVSDTTYFFSRNNVSEGGCDSTFYLYLTVNPVKTYQFSEEVCSAYIWGTDTLTVSNDYEKTFTTSKNCDSIVTLHLTILQPSYSSIRDTVCEGEIYRQNGFDLPEQTPGSKEYEITLTNQAQCDSVVTLYLEVNRKSYASLGDTVCPGTHYTEHGFDVHVPDTSGLWNYQLILTNSVGCDSIISLEILAREKYFSTVVDTICQGDPYTENGFDLPVQQQAGVQYDTLTLADRFGCDSIITLTLAVMPTYAIHIQDSIGYGETYDRNGFNITPSVTGIYRDTLHLASIHGCDSTISLSLTVTTRINELKASQLLKIYPNPALDHITISYPEVIESMEIFDIMGKSIHRERINATESRHNISQLKKGVYFIRVKTGKGELTKKLMIQ